VFSSDTESPEAQNVTTNPRVRINIGGLKALYPVDPVTIWRKCRAGEFPAPHYIGRRRFWFLDEIESWIAAQMAQPHQSKRPFTAGAQVDTAQP
jgi:hypothetical protein